MVASQDLHVATLNIAHGRGVSRSRLGKRRRTFESNLDSIASVLRRKKPDVIALQEADGPSSLSGRFCHVNRIREAADYPYYYHGFHARFGNGRTRLHYGTALLAQAPLKATESWAFGVDVIDTKGFVSAEIDVNGRSIIVVSVHLDFKSAWTRQKQAIMIARRFLHEDRPLILMGDFNCGWYKDDALRLLADHLKVRACRPDAGDMPTFRANRPRRRLDWIIVSRHFDFVDYQVWEDQISDHLGVSAHLKLANGHSAEIA